MIEGLHGVIPAPGISSVCRRKETSGQIQLDAWKPFSFTSRRSLDLGVSDILHKHKAFNDTDALQTGTEIYHPIIRSNVQLQV